MSQLKRHLILLALGACCASQQAAVADPYFDYGVQLLKKKDYVGARKYFETRLKFAPKDEKALYYRALTHHYAGERPTAKDQYQFIIDNFPDTEMATLAAQNLEKIKAAEDATKTEEEKQADKEREAQKKETEKSAEEKMIEQAKNEYQERIAPLVKRKTKF